jgi:hypothetical protein
MAVITNNFSGEAAHAMKKSGSASRIRGLLHFSICPPELSVACLVTQDALPGPIDLIDSYRQKLTTSGVNALRICNYKVQNVVIAYSARRPNAQTTFFTAKWIVPYVRQPMRSARAWI